MEEIIHVGQWAEPFDAFASFEAKSGQPELPGEAAPLPGQGTFFDEYIDLCDPAGAIFTERIVERYDNVRPKKRKKGRDALFLRIRKIAANAMRCHFFRDSPAVLYFAGADVKQYRDRPRWMKHGALGKVVNALVDAGLLHRIIGEKVPADPEKKSWTSSYWATDELVRLALECGISAESLDTQVPADELVQLYAPKPEAEFNKYKRVWVPPPKGKRIWFQPTAETREWTATIKAINAFYRQKKIAIGLTPADLDRWLTERNADPEREGARYRLPEMFSTDIRRIFNNGNEADPTFEQGGRMFHGWWMQIPEELRKAITINGEPTIELDYKNCHPRMLYHERGLENDGDLYSIPEIAAYEVETGVPPDTYRPCVKRLMQILINGRGRPDAVEQPAWMAVPPDIPIERIVALIEDKHRPIADAFKTGAGLRLMRAESDIALEIVSAAMDEGSVALSVHDSFITTVDQRDRLRALMIDAYVRRLGKEPMIKG